jgi:hypothetical protein
MVRMLVRGDRRQVVSSPAKTVYNENRLFRPDIIAVFAAGHSRRLLERSVATLRAEEAGKQSSKDSRKTAFSALERRERETTHLQVVPVTAVPRV